MRNKLFMLLVAIAFSSCEPTTEKKNESTKSITKSEFPQPIALQHVKPEGRLALRTETNFMRMHQGRYRPEFVHTWPSVDYHQENWPGDMVGRLILTLTLEEQVLGKESSTLRQLVDELEVNLNEKGYLGKIYTPDINEQQLSGHGWLLNGLSEYYKYTQDDKARRLLEGIVQNLVLETKGEHKSYPIDAEHREDAGGFMGSHHKQIGHWILSSDIGCDFIFMDGVVKTYEVLPSVELKDIVEEMIARFLEVDQVKIKAQTHATLTALRAILRYAELENKPELVVEAEKRFNIYKKVAMTENFENYNWYSRPKWTEPCAVIDSYIVAVNLWRLTGKSEFLADAQLIYYNAMQFEQRYSGSFGCSTCLGANSPMIKLTTNDTHWCCTMRGGVGLSRAAQYSWFTKDNNVYVVDYKDNSSELTVDGEALKFHLQTSYPFKGNVRIDVVDGQTSNPVVLHLFIPDWFVEPIVKIDGEKIEYKIENSFVVVTEKLTKGKIIEMDFGLKSGSREPVNENTIEDYFALFHGPLLLGAKSDDDEIYIDKEAKIIQIETERFKVEGTEIELQPVGHFMHPDVRKEYHTKEYVFQALFTSQK